MSVLDHVTAGTATLSRNHRRLDTASVARVAEAAAATACTTCRARRFDVGDAVELGSIWPDEDLGSYMVALTCRGCGAHTGIRLHEREFLSD